MGKAAAALGGDQRDCFINYFNELGHRRRGKTTYSLDDRCLCGGAGSREPSEPAVGMAATAVRRLQQAPTLAAVQVAAEPTLAGLPAPGAIEMEFANGSRMRGCG
jgi:hypothetical protein